MSDPRSTASAQRACQVRGAHQAAAAPCDRSRGGTRSALVLNLVAASSGIFDVLVRTELLVYKFSTNSVNPVPGTTVLNSTS